MADLYVALLRAMGCKDETFADSRSVLAIG
jgi:hypothetical protein